MHTKEKEKSGICCHVKDDQEKAEQLTYEHTVKIPEQKKVVNE